MRRETETKSGLDSQGKQPEQGKPAELKGPEGSILVEAIVSMPTIPNPALLRRLKPVNPEAVRDRADKREGIFRLVPDEKYWFNGTKGEIETVNPMTHKTKPGAPCGLATLLKVVKESK